MDVFLRVFLPCRLCGNIDGVICAMHRLRKINHLLWHVPRCRQQRIGACVVRMGIVGLLRGLCVVAYRCLILRHVNGLQAIGRAKDDGGKALLSRRGGFEIRHKSGRQRGSGQQGN